MKKSFLAFSITVSLSSISAQAEQINNESAFDLEISNTCIIRFSDDISKFDVEGKARGMLAKASAKAKHIYKNSYKGMAVNVNCNKAKTMFSNNSEIISFIPDGKIYANPKGGAKPGDGGSNPQVTPWSVTRVGGAVDGVGRTAWVLDTGIDVDHADLNVDTTRAFSAFTSGRDAGFDDKNGHGTHVAGTIAAIDNDIDVIGVAAGATVVPVKVLNARGSGSYSGIIAGLDYVAAHASEGDCVNMSLGGGFSQEVNDAVENAAQQSGAFFAIAAGNESQSASNVSPASASGQRIFTISATDSNDQFASFSNFDNPPVDYAAPGVSILSTKSGGGTTTLSGTSMASPAACAVLMMTGGNPSTDGVATNDPDGTSDPIIHL
ncbi:S8 family peptidase [Parashewanella curva]|uniref:S8 family peptidase n=1 Tax=Parashewanella curva TaxID=2338552 RepID=A0A3L8PSD7_9GAMM|nr:S8 family serine peptidase [Parashewanella curva]RLV57719.1 S8 family peptidase [Parashewanella curva]